MRGLLLTVAVALGGCGATSSSTAADAPGPATGTPARRTTSNPAMRYVQDGAPLGVMGTDGRVTLEGGEHVATVYDNGQVVDHEGTSIFAVTSAGHVVFSAVERDPMRLLDGQLAFGPDQVLTIDEAGNFRLGEDVVGIFVEGYQPEFARTAFLGWLALQFATIPWRRSITGEARESLELMYAAISEGGSLPSAASRTPSTIPCGEAAAWPEGAPPAFAALNFGPADPMRYAYSIEVDGDAFVLRAEGDVDCDGTTSRFELHGRRAADGITREPLLRVVDELE